MINLINIFGLQKLFWIRYVTPRLVISKPALMSFFEIVTGFGVKLNFELWIPLYLLTWEILRDKKMGRLQSREQTE